MNIHKGRLALVLVVVALMTLAGGAWYRLQTRRSRELAAIEARAQTCLTAGEYAAAGILADQLLRQGPDNGRAHLLKGQSLLEGHAVISVRASDARGMDGIRHILAAARRDPNLLEAHELLVPFFLSSGNVADAATHARAVLRSQPDDLDAHYALAAAALETGQLSGANQHLQFLLEQEEAVRPRTAWLAARLGEMLGERETLRQEAIDLLAGYAETPKQWPSVSDRLALARLRAWGASAADDPGRAERELSAVLAELEQLLHDEATNDNVPRQVLDIVGRLIPEQRPAALADMYAALEPQVTDFIERVLRDTTTAGVLDPAIYIELASRLVARGEAEEAVGLLEWSLAMAQEAGPQVRHAFTACDMWLAEHHLGRREGDKAEPHIQAMLGTDRWRGWGQMFLGYWQLQQDKLADAAQSLQAATAALPKRGTAYALFGLCQLRRGLISEGRAALEQAIRLGAEQPQYKAWLALALGEAGYREQSLAMAQQVLATPQTRSLGHALLGQLRLHAGQLEAAEQDLNAALQAADEALRPSLLISQLELLLTQNRWQEAQAILADLKKTPLAPQAYAAEHGYLTRQGRTEEATSLLDEARAQYPDHPLLLATKVRALVNQSQYDQAAELLQRFCETHQSVAATLMLSEVYDAASDPQKSVAVLAKAAEQYPNESALRIRLAEKHLAERRFEEADRLLTGLRNDPAVQSTTLDYLAARSAALRGDLDTAESIIQQAASKDPDNPTLKFLLGQLAMRKGDYSTASQLLEHSLANGAFRQQAVRALFDSLLRSGETDRAISLLAQARRWGHTVRPLHSRLLGVLARREKWDDLERELDTFLREDPSETNYALAVSVLRLKRQPDDAQRILEQGLKGNPQSMILREQQVSLLLEHGQLAEADRQLGALLDREPANPTLHVLRVYSLLENGRLPEAAEAVREGWKLCAGYPALAALRVQVLLRQGQTAEALAFAERAQQQYPHLPSAKHLVARMHEAIGQRDQALALLAELLKQEPDNAKASQAYLRLLISQGQTSGFEAEVQKLIAANPQNALLRGVLAEYYAARADVSRTQATVDKLQNIQTSGTLLAYLRALVAFSQNDLASCEKWLNVALADPRGHVPSTLLLARLRARERRFEDALQLVSQIRYGRPSFAPAHLLYARLLLRLERAADAEVVCRQFLRLEPGSNPFRALLSEILFLRGGQERRNEALALAEETLQQGVRDPANFESLIKTLLRGGRTEKALTFAEKPAKETESTELVLAGGKACFAVGEFASARRLAETVLQQEPRHLTAALLSADSLVELAKSANDAQQFEAAAQSYRQILQRHPGNLTAANNLAWTVGSHLGRPERALQELLAHVPTAKTPSRQLPPELLDTVGTLHLQTEHLTEAQTFLEAATALKPGDAIAHFHLGQVYQKQRRPERARQHFEKALSLQPGADWSGKIRESMMSN